MRINLSSAAYTIMQHYADLGCSYLILVQGAELPTRQQVLSAATQAGLELAAPSGTVQSGTDRGHLGKHFAATLRVWRLQLVHVWHACWKVGARDGQLRQCAPVTRLLAELETSAMRFSAAYSQCADEPTCSTGNPAVELIFVLLPRRVAYM